jgi:molecular chaperone IbpA
MRAIDFSPLFRSTVGFDRVQRALDTATRLDNGATAYPPYNIEAHGDDAYRITMAVAGFSEDNLDVTAKENSLVISGKNEAEGGEAVKVLHRGIAGRGFERRFELADHIKVADASLVNGLLHIDLVREVPEEKKARKIAIEKRAETKALAA